MGFWKKVEIEINYYGISRKELSAKSGVPITTINRAIELDTKPFALDALKISKALGISLDYLLDYNGTENKNPNDENESEKIEMYKKYHSVITAIESLPQSKQKSAISLIQQLTDICK